MRRLLLLIVPALGLAPAPSAAADRCSDTVEITVDDLNTPEDELLRVADLAGATPGTAPRLIRRGGPRRERLCAAAASSAPFQRLAGDAVPPGGDVAVEALPLRLGTVWNGRHPSGDNDELLWAGRGVSQLLSTGATLRAGALTLTLAPQVSWSENKAFRTVPTAPGQSPFANAFYPQNIDLPQRFGAGAFATWSLGQSALRLEGWNAQVGLSTENLWIGSGIRSSILMTSTGPGFPHAFIGTARPVDVRIGDVEALVFWGRLERSRYADDRSGPMLQGLVLTYGPRWVPGLTLGAGRLMTQRWSDLRARDWFAVLWTGDKGDVGTADNRDNELVGLFFRWVFPESGAEVYGEWAREDYEDDIYSFIHDPDHSQAYLVGLQKVFKVRSGLLRVHVELLQLQNRRSLTGARGVPIYYIHSNGLDFTSRGQLLGSGVGPGGSSQTLAADWFHRGGRVGGYFERTLRNDEYFWEKVEPTGMGTLGRDIELRLGARQSLAVGPVEVAWDVSWARRWRRDFVDWENNGRLMLELRVPLGGGRPRPALAATAPASGR